MPPRGLGLVEGPEEERGEGDEGHSGRESDGDVGGGRRREQRRERRAHLGEVAPSDGQGPREPRAEEEAEHGLLGDGPAGDDVAEGIEGVVAVVVVVVVVVFRSHS